MSLLLLLKGGVAAPPPATPAGVIPTPVIEIDFVGNPTATYADIHNGADGVVSFWRMNSTSTFLDELGANNGIMVSTPSTITGPYPYDTDVGLTFDGSNDSAYVLDAPSIATKTAFSIGGWVQTAALPASTKDLACKQGAWRLQLTATGKVVWTLQDDTSTVTITSNTTLATGLWYYVAAVYDDTQALLYINGVLDSASAYSSGMGLSGQPIRFAGSMATTAPTWQSTTTATGNSNTVTGAKPASTASGDLLIAHIAINITAATVPTATPPTGWLLRTAEQPTNRSFSQVYTRVADGSEPASYTWVVNQPGDWSCAITRITGQDPISPIEASYGVAQVTASTTHSTGEHLGDTENNLVFACFYSRAASTWTEDSGTERYDFGNLNTIAASTQSQASPAPITVTGTSSNSVAGAAHLLFIVGLGVNELACSLDDWAYWNRALSVAEVARNFYSRDSGVGTWTDVTANVRNLDITGTSRQYELDQMEAGTTALLLGDADRSYDPANTSSVYSPNVIPMRKMRGRTTYQGTVYDLFYTYIERWPPQNAIAGYQEIGITAVDGFDALALADVSGSLEVGYSGAQIDKLLDKALWPQSARAIDPGQYVMAAQTLSGTKALGAIQEIAASERGIFFIDQAGIATFHDSAHRGSFSRSTTSQVTFVDDIAGTGIPYQDLAPSFDKDKIINDWTVTPDSTTFGAADQEQEDALSVARFWRHSNSRSTRLISNADALAQAGNLLNDTAQPALRFDSLTVLPTSAAAYTACLGLRVSDRVTVRRGDGPVWDGAILSKECFVEAKKISAEPGNPWAFTFALSPASLGNYRATIVRDGPVSYWRMDSVT